VGKKVNFFWLPSPGGKKWDWDVGCLGLMGFLIGKLIKDSQFMFAVSYCRFLIADADVKVCAVDEQWSALKLMVRKETR